MASTSLKINRFDPRTMETRRLDGNPSTCIFIGKRGTGKHKYNIKIIITI